MTSSKLNAAYIDYQTHKDVDALLAAVHAYAMTLTYRDEDIAQIGTTLVWRGLTSYDPTKSGFATWSNRIIKNAMWTERGRKINTVMEPTPHDEIERMQGGHTSGALRSPMLRDLLLESDAQLASLLSLSLSMGGDINEAGAHLGMGKGQVDWAKQKLRRLAATFSAA